jgi:V8-like Glu-specific endopeptidase
VHFLDDSEYDFSKPEAREFYEILVRAYSTPQAADMALATAGIDRSGINFGQGLRFVWKGAVEVAARSGKLRALAMHARDDGSIAAYRARLERLVGPTPAATEAPVPAAPAKPWSGKELITGAQETFLEASFLYEGARVAPAVVRLTTWAHGQKYYGSGFLITPDTILTNHHVLFDEVGKPVSQVEIWFNFESDAAGKPREVDSYEGDPASIVGEETHDWAVIKPKKPFKAGYPTLSLRPTKPVSTDDFVYIIQHPKGRSKQIGLIHNQVVNVTADMVHYLTDTLPGSSGSPVCNDRWEVVALHHRGIDESIVPGSVKKNQGVPIQRVVEGLIAKGILKADGTG